MTYSDAGRYSCVLGQQTQKVELLVEYPESVALDQLRKNVFITASIAGNVMHSGDRLMLNCGISNRDNKFNIMWEKIQGLLPPNAQISGRTPARNYFRAFK